MRIKEFRESKNLTQQQMADKIGISLSFYSKIEAGFKKPSYNFIKKVTEAFDDVNTNIFFEEINHSKWL